jgi:predicted GNAT family acetyltransferase
MLVVWPDLVRGNVGPFNTVLPELRSRGYRVVSLSELVAHAAYSEASTAEAIVALLTELGYPASVAEVPSRLAAVAGAPGQVLLAESAGKVLGVASATHLTLLHRPQAVALLSALVVREEHRGLGVGQALVEAAAREAAAYHGLGFESRSRKFVRPVPG